MLPLILFKLDFGRAATNIIILKTAYHGTIYIQTDKKVIPRNEERRHFFIYRIDTNTFYLTYKIEHFAENAMSYAVRHFHKLDGIPIEIKGNKSATLRYKTMCSR